MTTKERIIDILQKIKPTKDLSSVEDIVEGGYMESLELMGLIFDLSEAFQIEIDIEDISPENFNSADAMARLVDRLKA